MRLGGIDDEPAGELLDTHHRQLAPTVRGQLLEQAGGNPLALVELPMVLGDGRTRRPFPASFAAAADRASGAGVRRPGRQPATGHSQAVAARGGRRRRRPGRDRRRGGGDRRQGADGRGLRSGHRCQARRGRRHKDRLPPPARALCGLPGGEPPRAQRGSLGAGGGPRGPARPAGVASGGGARRARRERGRGARGGGEARETARRDRRRDRHARAGRRAKRRSGAQGTAVTRRGRAGFRAW